MSISQQSPPHNYGRCWAAHPNLGPACAGKQQQSAQSSSHISRIDQHGRPALPRSRILEKGSPTIQRRRTQHSYDHKNSRSQAQGRHQNQAEPTHIDKASDVAHEEQPTEQQPPNTQKRKATSANKPEHHPLEQSMRKVKVARVSTTTCEVLTASFLRVSQERVWNIRIGLDDEA